MVKKKKEKNIFMNLLIVVKIYFQNLKENIYQEKNMMELVMIKLDFFYIH